MASVLRKNDAVSLSEPEDERVPICAAGPPGAVDIDVTREANRPLDHCRRQMRSCGLYRRPERIEEYGRYINIGPQDASKGKIFRNIRNTRPSEQFGLLTRHLRFSYSRAHHKWIVVEHFLLAAPGRKQLVARSEVEYGY